LSSGVAVFNAQRRLAFFGAAGRPHRSRDKNERRGWVEPRSRSMSLLRPPRRISPADSRSRGGRFTGA
jgi:hypothetical protein